MVKAYLNFVFLIIIVTIFLYLLCSPDIHGFRTPRPTQPSGIYPVVTTGQPYYLSPSNVRIVETPTVTLSKSGFYVGRDSPTESVAASTVCGVPTEYPPFKPETNNVEVVNKRKESVGERICRRIFNRFVSTKLGYGKEVMGPIRPNFLKNPKTGHNLELDMFEAFDSRITDKNQIIDGIAIEYNGLQHDQYVPGMHEDEAAFTEQQFRDNHKASICGKKGIILIIIDTKIDVSRILNTTGKGKRKYINLSESQREENIEAVLLPKLEEAYTKLMLSRRNW